MIRARMNQRRDSACGREVGHAGRASLPGDGDADCGGAGGSWRGRSAGLATGKVCEAGIGAIKTPMSLIIEIPDSVAEAMRIPLPERESRVLADLACALYAGEVLPLGKAAELAGMDRFRFAGELGKRNIPRHYDASCLAEDLEDDHG